MVTEIKKLCQDFGTNIKNVEIAVGLPNGSIRRWDDSSPAIDKVFRVAKYFGVSLAYHLGWSEASTMREGGWSNNKTVHDVYTHLSALDFNEDIKKMEAFYTQQKTHNTENRANEITNV